MLRRHWHSNEVRPCLGEHVPDLPGCAVLLGTILGKSFLSMSSAAYLCVIERMELRKHNFHIARHIVHVYSFPEFVSLLPLQK